MKRKNIFVVGLEDFHLAQLKALRKTEHYNFLPLFRYEEIKGVDRFPVKECLQETEERLKRFSGPIDAIIGYWDFPVSTMLPILRRKAGLPTPSLESVLKCEHKYWSRLEQAEVIKGHIPRFAKVNPFADDPLSGVDIDYPFWLKPVKAVLSYLGFKINNEAEFNQSIGLIRQKIARYAEPFNHLLSYADLPEKVADVDGYHCLAEAIIPPGRQCTLEGYAFAGKVHAYGIVDSTREGPHGSCFSSYRYPARLPKRIQQEMAELSKRVIRHIGYDNAPFNIEFFWDEHSDRIWLLEINTRISKSHSPLFYMVDGEYHHQVMIDLALGERPDFPHRKGSCHYAAKFMPRKYQDALVTRVPSDAEISAIRKRWPGTLLQIPLKKGMHLSQLRDQDSYSYEVAVIFMGADDEQQLLQKYRHCLQMLPLEFSDSNQ